MRWPKKGSACADTGSTACGSGFERFNTLSALDPFVSASFRFDGRDIPFEQGDSVASALHRAGVKVLSRSFKYHRPRGIYCCTGSCASCMVAIDGIPNVIACTTPAERDLDVTSQNTVGGARRDLLGIVDKVYRKGFDPHGAFTGSRALNKAFNVGVRFMSGIGKVPEEALDGHTPRRFTHHYDEVIVGSGANGLRRAHEASGRVLVVEEAALGGSLRFDPSPLEGKLAQGIADLGDVETWTGALAFGIYGKVLAIEKDGDLHEVTADRFTIAPGCHDAWPVFVNNDAPGVLSLRGASRLLREHRVLPGQRIVGHGARLPQSFVDALEAQGGAVVAQGTVSRVRGHGVEQAVVNGQRVDCDAVVCNLPGTPRVELFQQAGCELTFDNPYGGLAPRTDADGRTSRDDLWAAFTPVEAP